jgi:hypothetical protein
VFLVVFSVFFTDFVLFLVPFIFSSSCRLRNVGRCPYFVTSYATFRVASVRFACHLSQVTHRGHCRSNAAHLPTPLFTLRSKADFHSKTEAFNLVQSVRRVNALSFASRLGQGVAPLDALFFSLREFSLR